MHIVARLSLISLVFAAACTGSGPSSEELIDLDNDGYYVNAPNEEDQDCADGDPTINPGAIEICDRRDNDCNKLFDDNAEGALEWFPDDDGDGFGLYVDEPTLSCSAPPGFAANRLDCNDEDGRVYPNAPERCNELDDNCNLVADEGIDLSTDWYGDRDGDGDLCLGRASV